MHVPYYLQSVTLAVPVAFLIMYELHADGCCKFYAGGHASHDPWYHARSDRGADCVHQGELFPVSAGRLPCKMCPGLEETQPGPAKPG